MLETIGRNLSPGAIIAAARFAQRGFKASAAMPRPTVRLYAGPLGAGIIEATNRITLASITGFETVADFATADCFAKGIEFFAADLVDMAARAFAADPGASFEIRADRDGPDDVVELMTPGGSGGRVAVTAPTVPLAAAVLARFAAVAPDGTPVSEPVFRAAIPGDYLGALRDDIRRTLADAALAIPPRDAALLFYRDPARDYAVAFALAERDGGHFTPGTALDRCDILGWSNAVPVALILGEIEPIIGYAIERGAASVTFNVRVAAPATVRVFDTGPESGTGTFLVAPLRSKTTRVAIRREAPAVQEAAR